MDLESTLQEYQIQLQQAELALRNDPENQELLRLKKDLEVRNSKTNFISCN